MKGILKIAIIVSICIMVMLTGCKKEEVKEETERTEYKEEKKEEVAIYPIVREVGEIEVKILHVYELEDGAKKYNHAHTGCIYLCIICDVRNNGEEGQYYTYDFWKAYADGKSVESYKFPSDITATAELEIEELGMNETIRGTVVYEISEEWEELTIEVTDRLYSKNVGRITIHRSDVIR